MELRDIQVVFAEFDAADGRDEVSQAGLVHTKSLPWAQDYGEDEVRVR